MFTSTQVRRSVSYFSKLGFVAILGLFSLAGQAFASENSLPNGEPSSEIIEADYTLDLSDLKQVPTITFVDKNLNIVAEFYGDFSEIKSRFPESFQDDSLLNEFYNHKIFLVKSSAKK
jgi:hypothetical protein